MFKHNLNSRNRLFTDKNKYTPFIQPKLTASVLYATKRWKNHNQNLVRKSFFRFV